MYKNIYLDLAKTVLPELYNIIHIVQFAFHNSLGVGLGGPHYCFLLILWL